MHLHFIGVPDEIKSTASFGETGSEESVSAIFKYNNGHMATIYSSFRTNTGIGCDILCEKGNLTRFARTRYEPESYHLPYMARKRKHFVFSPPALGYHWEAEEVMNCLDQGLKESPVVPLSFSIELMNTLDRIRNEAGIVFPGRD